MPFPLVVVVALSLAQIPPPKVESFWPVSIVAYMTAASQILIWIAWIRQSRKDDKAPIYEKIDQQTGELKLEIERVEKDFAKEIAVARREIEKDLNGLGSRLTDTEKEVGVALAGNVTMSERMTRSELDRADLRKEIERNRHELAEFRKEMLKEQRAARKSNRIARAQILAAIATIKTQTVLPK